MQQFQFGAQVSQVAPDRVSRVAGNDAIPCAAVLLSLRGAARRVQFWPQLIFAVVHPVKLPAWKALRYLEHAVPNVK
eukprot:5145212-Amphidinium_carterae.1